MGDKQVQEKTPRWGVLQAILRKRRWFHEGSQAADGLLGLRHWLGTVGLAL